MSNGIEARHRKGCPASFTVKVRKEMRERGEAAACACQPSYRAVVRNRHGKVSRTFHRLADAREWRATALADVIRTPRLASKAPTVRAASIALLAGMRNGAIRTRSGDPYKPGVTRAYEATLNRLIIPVIGSLRLDQVELRDVQAIADAELSAGLSPGSARNSIIPLRVIYRRAIRDGDVSTNPCARVDLPAVRSKRDRVASPEEAVKLLSVLSTRDRAWWGLAFYAGLRRGEIRGLRRENVDLAAGLIYVKDGWDAVEGRIDPKSIAGARSVIIVATLRDILAAHFVDGQGEFLFPSERGSRVIHPSAVVMRAHAAWDDAKLKRIGMHEARHTFASYMIAAGVNAKALSEMLGHSSISITFDIYGHLMPGSWDEARDLVDAYLERAAR